jgi:hypothetical protein
MERELSGCLFPTINDSRLALHRRDRSGCPWSFRTQRRPRHLNWGCSEVASLERCRECRLTQGRGRAIPPIVDSPRRYFPPEVMQRRTSVSIPPAFNSGQEMRRESANCVLSLAPRGGHSYSQSRRGLFLGSSSHDPSRRVGCASHRWADRRERDLRVWVRAGRVPLLNRCGRAK